MTTGIIQRAHMQIIEEQIPSVQVVARGAGAVGRGCYFYRMLRQGLFSQVHLGRDREIK